MGIPELLGKAIVPVAVLIAFAFFRKQYPNNPSNLSKKQIEDLDVRFRSMKWIPQIVLVVVGVVFFFGTHAALLALSQQLASTKQWPRIVLLPQSAIWWLFPGFGALALSWEITLQIGTLIWNRQIVKLYSDWSDATQSYWGRGSQFDSRKVLRLLALFVALPIGILTILALPMHATITPEEITDCGYAFKTCHVYHLSEAVRITDIEGFRNRDGDLQRRAGLVVDFKGGRRWDSSDWGNWKTQVDPALRSILEDGTGLTIQRAKTAEDIPR